MKTKQASNTTAWNGWRRPDPCSPWRAIVTADDDTMAFNRLLDTVHGGGKCVLPRGIDPNVRKEMQQ
jgi:hypothetical protein